LEKSRLCYVIMPFSATASCSEDQWTEIFDHLIKPAVEKAGLGYECRRSDANLGNIIKAIVQSLEEAHVVIADLTDQNPNVFYELGVRHALSDRTILLAQNIDAIPFDLRPYATHVYSWNTDSGRKNLRSKLRKLLSQIDSEPERSDNPVSDFLTGQNRARSILHPRKSEHATGGLFNLLKEHERELEAASLLASIRDKQNIPDIRKYVREKRAFFQSEWPQKISDLGASQTESRALGKEEVYDYALPLVAHFDADISEVESLGLAAVESEWKEGLAIFLHLPCDWITLSEKRISPYRAIQSAPNLCAFRFLTLLTARAINNSSFDLVELMVREPLETRESGNQLDMRSLIQRKRLFYSEALFGRADLTVHYLTGLWDRCEHLHSFFASKDEYYDALSKYYLLSCLGGLVASPQASLIFPGYAMIPGHGAALSSLIMRMQSNPPLVSSIARSLGETDDAFRGAWPERAAAINADSRRVNWAIDFSLPNKL